MTTQTNRKISNGSFRSIFMHADRADILLMLLGFLGAVGDGFAMPTTLLIVGKIMNNIGDSDSDSSSTMKDSIDKMNQNAANLCYMAIGVWVACFLGGTVWSVGAAIAIGGISLGSALSNVKYFSDAMAASQRIREVIKRVPEIDSDNMDGKILQDVSGEVEFKGVNFAYPSRPETVIFKDFNLKVPAGKTVALVGGSGSGKSTMIALLQRFYDAQGGEISVDGVRIDKLQLKWLRSQMGLVSQEPALFATTIKENILFGKEDATMEEVIEAAKASNAHNFTLSFLKPMTLSSNYGVGERGVQMSGGQKQRIAIARAIIKSPRILLLDEATSALDTESERVVQEALDQAAVGRTTIVIAHRLSTIRNADVIVVVQNGQVVESGSHDDLIQLEDGFYTSLVRLQETKQNDEPQNSYPAGPSSVTSTLDLHNMSSRRQSTVSRSSSTNSVDRGGGENFKLATNQEFLVPSFKRLLAMNTPERKEALLGSIGAILFGAIQPLYSFALGSVISVYFLEDHDEIKRRTRIYSLCFAGLGVFSMVINIIQHYNFAAMGEQLTKRVRERMLAKILTFEIGWFDQGENSSGAICSRLAKDANVVRSLVGDRSALLIQTFSAVIIACTMGLVIAWRLALVMIAVQPLIIVCFYCKRVLLKNMSQKAMKSQDKSSKLAAEAVSNLRTVTAFSSQSRILKMLVETQKAPMRESIKQAWYAGLGLGFSQSLMACTWALDFWYGGKLISDGQLGAKALSQTFLILVSTGRVIAEAGTMTNDLAKGSDAVQSVFALPGVGTVTLSKKGLRYYGAAITWVNIIYRASEDVCELGDHQGAKSMPNAHDFYSRLSNKTGYDTWCGDRRGTEKATRCSRFMGPVRKVVKMRWGIDGGRGQKRCGGPPLEYHTKL
ncbi:ABC transporter family protein [Tanacetum coccineum]